MNPRRKLLLHLSTYFIINEEECPHGVWDEMTQVKREVRQERKARYEEEAANIQLTTSLKRSVDLAKEKGASSWLAALPLESQGFTLYKSAFWDVLALRYNWLPERMSSTCACSEPFTVEHALSCPKGAFPIY